MVVVLMAFSFLGFLIVMGIVYTLGWGKYCPTDVDSVMLSDVIERHRVTSVVVLRQLIRRLLSAPCARFSVARFHADLKSRQIAHSRLPKPAVPAGIEVHTTWQWMMELH